MEKKDEKKDVCYAPNRKLKQYLVILQCKNWERLQNLVFESSPGIAPPPYPSCVQKEVYIIDHGVSAKSHRTIDLHVEIGSQYTLQLLVAQRGLFYIRIDADQTNPGLSRIFQLDILQE